MDKSQELQELKERFEKFVDENRDGAYVDSFIGLKYMGLDGDFSLEFLKQLVAFMEEYKKLGGE